MLSIIYDTLVRPSKIATHVDEKPFRKFLGFLVVMLILAVIPVFFAQSQSITFSNEEARVITRAFTQEQPITYEIKDGKLIYTGEGEPEIRSYEFKENTFNMTTNPVYVIFSLDGSGYQINSDPAYMVIFKENEIELRYCPNPYKASNENGGTLLSGISSLLEEKEEVVKTIKYEKLNVNFDTRVTTEKRLFNNIYNIGNKIYGKLKWSLILGSAALSISYIIGSFISTISLTILLLFLLFRFYGVRFRKVIKISFLCCTPYVLFNLLGYLYNATFFIYVGEILTIYYIYKTMRTYALLNMMNQRGGNL